MWAEQVVKKMWLRWCDNWLVGKEQVTLLDLFIDFEFVGDGI